MTTIREQINKDGWWSSRASERNELLWEYFWDVSVMQNLSKVGAEESLHVEAVHCVAITGDRGQPTVRNIFKCEEGVYYRDSYDFVSQIQMMIDWTGSVENWPPIMIDPPDQKFKRYRLIPKA